MSRGSLLLWLVRIVGIAILTLAHLVVLTALLASSIGGSLAQGPNGEDMGHVYYESEEGRRTELLIDILQWPIAKPLSIIGGKISGAALQSIWRTISAAGFYLNSLIWGIAGWFLIEAIVRGLGSLSRPRTRA